MRKPIAVLCSDIHLSAKAPVARSAEPDWHKAMSRPLRALRKAAKRLDVPVVCAGDVFDKWNAPAELINFALEELPDAMLTIPGQHDLPYHEYEAMGRSAYGTLVKAGKITDLGREHPHHIQGLSLWPFPWGSEINPPGERVPNAVNLAVIHAYVWHSPASGYVGADIGKLTIGYAKRLRGYDTAVFGDNHKGFISAAGKCVIFNHGGFMRRKSDEIGYAPGYGVLYSDGSVERVLFDTSKERWIDDLSSAKGVEVVEGHITDFIKELKSGSSDTLDFHAALERYLSLYTVSDGAKRILLEHQ